MRKGAFKRLWALIRGRFVCRIYDGDIRVFECYNLMQASMVLADLRKKSSVDYQLKLEEV